MKQEESRYVPGTNCFHLFYLKYDIEDDTNSDTVYHFPFIQKVYINENTEIIGNLQKGNIVEVEYENLSESLVDLKLKSIKVIE